MEVFLLEHIEEYIPFMFYLLKANFVYSTFGWFKLIPKKSVVQNCELNSI